MSGPVYFGCGSETRRLFGCLSLPPADTKPHAKGVVLCNPFGYEALCMHRAYRQFARAFAGAGYPALRFDYDGTGDSSGTDPDPERVRAWVDSIHSASAFLRAQTGVRQVYLFGIRLGATLAASAAGERDDYAGLLAIVPILNPEAYLRELAAFHAWSRFEKPPGGKSGLGEGDQEAGGFVVTAGTVAALSAIDLSSPSNAPVPAALVIDRADRPEADGWVQRLRGLGVNVSAQRHPGFRELNVDPHKSVVPQAMVEASVAWLAGQSEECARLVRPAQPTAAMSDEAVEIEPGVAEKAVFLAGNPWLFGILATPIRVSLNGLAVILVNAGKQHHIGPNRLWVTLARRWARLGVVTLRLDFSGTGESSPRPGRRDFADYDTPGALDIADAATSLRTTWAAREVYVVGLCSGGYHALRAAAQGAPIDGFISLNQEMFRWDPEPLEAVPSYLAVAETKRYGHALLDVDSWKKLVRGHVHLGTAGRILQKRVFDMASNRARQVARRLGLHFEDHLASSLVAIAKRNIHMCFVACAGEPALELLREQGGRTVDELERRGILVLESIAGPDHTFTPIWTHHVLTACLERHLGFASRRGSAETCRAEGAGSPPSLSWQ